MRIKRGNIQQPVIGANSELQSFFQIYIGRGLPRRKTVCSAFTLVEMLAVIAVIVILAAIVLSVVPRLDTQNKISLTQNTFAILNTALSEFHDYGFAYTGNYAGDNFRLTFPIDCNNFTAGELQNALQSALGKTIMVSTSASDNRIYSGTQALYFLLKQVPQSSQTIEKIDSKLLVRSSTNDIIEVTDEGRFPLMHINDAWGRPLQYDYYDDEANPGSTIMRRSIKIFPVLISAGPDGIFGTADDIKSR